MDPFSATLAFLAGAAETAGAAAAEGGAAAAEAGAAAAAEGAAATAAEAGAATAEAGAAAAAEGGAAAASAPPVAGPAEGAAEAGVAANDWAANLKDTANEFVTGFNRKNSVIVNKGDGSTDWGKTLSRAAGRGASTAGEQFIKKKTAEGSKARGMLAKFVTGIGQ